MLKPCKCPVCGNEHWIGGEAEDKYLERDIDAVQCTKCFAIFFENGTSGIFKEVLNAYGVNSSWDIPKRTG